MRAADAARAEREAGRLEAEGRLASATLAYAEASQLYWEAQDRESSWAMDEAADRCLLLR